MKRLFVETLIFQATWKECNLSDEDYFNLQNYLLENPDAGDVIAGTGGVRKLRHRMEGRGKRGGARVLYLDFPSFGTMYLLYAYGKNEQENITQQEKRRLIDMVTLIENGLKNRSE